MSLAVVTHCNLSSAASTFTVGFTVSGLTPNSGLVLQNGSDVLPISAAGTGAFPTPLPSGASYNVTIAQVPGNPVQYCTIANGSGTIGNANVTAPRITCAVRYGRYAYTTGSCPASCSTGADSTISIFGLAASGQWRNRGYQLTTGTATAVRVFPSQQWVYATTSPAAQALTFENFPSGGTLTGYQIDGGTGRLTAINSAPTDPGPLAIEFDPLGRFAFVANESAVTASGGTVVSKQGSIDSFKVDPRSGALTATGAVRVPASIGDPKKLVADPSGHFVYAVFQDSGAGGSSSIATFTVNQSSGALAAGTVLSQPNGLTPVDLQFDPAGRFLYVVSSPDTVTTYQINPASGVLAPVSVASAGTEASPGTLPVSIAIDPASQFAFVLNSSVHANVSGVFNEVSVFSINAASGVLTPIASPLISSNFGLASLQVDPSGNFLEIASFSPESGQTVSSYEITTFPINRGTGRLSGPTNSSGALLPASTVETRGILRDSDLLPAGFSIARGSSPAAPVGKFAFVTNSKDANISTFAINSSGGMTLQGTTSTGSQPDFIALDPLGLTAYVTSNSTQVMSKFSVDPTTGTLNLVGQFTGQTGPGALVVDPSGRFAYTGEGTDIQGFSGTTPLGVVGSTADTCQKGVLGQICGTIDGLAIDPTGRFLFASTADVSAIHEFSINPSNGALTEIGSISTNENPFVLAAEPTGRFVYSVDSVGGTITSYTIAPSGALTLSAGFPAPTAGVNSFGVAIDPTGQFLYMAGQLDQELIRLFIDPVTGSISRNSGAGAFVSLSAPIARTLSMDPSGKFLYVPGEETNTISTYKLNPTSGAMTLSGSTSSGSFPFSIAVTGVTP